MIRALWLLLLSLGVSGCAFTDARHPHESLTTLASRLDARIVEIPMGVNVRGWGGLTEEGDLPAFNALEGPDGVTGVDFVLSDLIPLPPVTRWCAEQLDPGQSDEVEAWLSTTLAEGEEATREFPGGTVFADPGDRYLRVEFASAVEPRSPDPRDVSLDEGRRIVESLGIDYPAEPEREGPLSSFRGQQGGVFVTVAGYDELLIGLQVGMAQRSRRIRGVITSLAQLVDPENPERVEKWCRSTIAARNGGRAFPGGVIQIQTVAGIPGFLDGAPATVVGLQLTPTRLAESLATPVPSSAGK